MCWYGYLPGCFSFSCRLIRSQNTTIEAITAPANAERNITIAKDPSNFQNKKEMDTGAAFCTENVAINNMIINASIIMLIQPPHSCSSYV